MSNQYNCKIMKHFVSFLNILIYIEDSA